VEALDYLDADGDVAVLAQFARAISHLPVGESYDDARSSLRNALEQAREAVHDLAALSEPESFDASALKELEIEPRFCKRWREIRLVVERTDDAQ